MLAKSQAFFLRDLRAAVTYRVSFIESFFGMVFGLVSMLFVSDLINQGSPDDLAAYGGDYFGFALVGVSFALFAQVVAGQFAGVVRSAQVTGTLEVMLSSRTSLPGFLGYSSLYGFAYAVLRLVVALTIGALFLGANLQVTDAALTTVVFVLTVDRHLRCRLCRLVQATRANHRRHYHALLAHQRGALSDNRAA
jgi:ABC-2 type transport system permease protein